jgi:hypothetical protein
VACAPIRTGAAAEISWLPGCGRFAAGDPMPSPRLVARVAAARGAAPGYSGGTAPASDRLPSASAVPLYRRRSQIARPPLNTLSAINQGDPWAAA